VHVSKVWRGAAIAAAVGGLVAAGTSAALAQPAQAPLVTISAQSANPPVTHDVFVVYRNTYLPKGTHLREDQVRVSGSVSQSAAGQVAALFAQPFPYKAKPAEVAGQSLTLPTSSTPVSYSFKAAPTIATKYTVKVLPSSTTSSPVVGTSPTTTVYVVTNQPTTAPRNCSRPVCHQTLKVYTHLAKSAYNTESKKKWYFYFGLRLSATGEPSFPRWLYLQKATISKVKRISSTEFERSITWSFRIGNDGYAFLFSFCSKDSESKDGMNLPGSHSCGAKKVRSNIAYLG